MREHDERGGGRVGVTVAIISFIVCLAVVCLIFVVINDLP